MDVSSPKAIKEEINFFFFYFCLIYLIILDFIFILFYYSTLLRGRGVYLCIHIHKGIGV